MNEPMKASQPIDWLEERAREDAQNALIFKRAKSKLKKRMSDKLLILMSDSNNYDYEIKRNPLGDRQLDRELKGLKYFVNQTCNGGYTGDDFAGTISVQIAKNEFFQFSYNM